jgi:hypothetical protein
MSNCNCDYTISIGQGVVQCHSCVSATDTAEINQKRIWGQVRVPGSLYTMNLAALSSGAARIASQTTLNWNQRSDRVLAARQTIVHPSHGNSVHSSLTSGRPGASSPGGVGVDVKHDSYARYLNRKKAQNFKTQTQNKASVPIQGNKTYNIGLLANSTQCCA